LIFESANHRNEGDISATWTYYIESIHQKVIDGEINAGAPYEAIINVMIEMSHRLKNSEITFSSAMLIPLIEQYAIENQAGVGPKNWIPDLFIRVGFAHEAIVASLQQIYMNDIAPFVGRQKAVIAYQILYVCEQWYQDCVRSNKRLFDTEENAFSITEILQMLVQNGLRGEDAERANSLRQKIERSYR
jgi:nuclear pore complex protein Nup155